VSRLHSSLLALLSSTLFFHMRVVSTSRRGEGRRRLLINKVSVVHIDNISLSFSCVLCLFRQVHVSNDASLLYHKLFSLYVHIQLRCSSSSLSSYHSASQFLTLPFCLLRLYAEGIRFSTYDLTNFSVFVGWYSSTFCFHPPCLKPLDWIGVQSN